MQKNRPRWHRWTKSARWTMLVIFAVMGTMGQACEQEERFKVPSTYKRMKVRNQLVYSTRGKVPIPKSQTLPLWSEMIDSSASSVFRSELVRLQGVRWNRESSGKIYDIYFRSDNHMAARTLAQIGNHLAFFASRWFGRPFPGRISVVLMPSKQPEAPRPAIKHAPAKVAPRLAQPSAQPSSQPVAVPSRPIAVPTRPIAVPARSVAPSTRPVSPSTRPATRSAAPVVARVQPTTKAAQPAPPKARSAGRTKPLVQLPPTTKRSIQPAPVAREATPRTPPTPRSGGLQIPEVGPYRIVIYTGTTNNPVFSRFGLISVLLSRTIRISLTGRPRRDPRSFWRSVVFPAYFALRGTGAMVDLSYDKTMTPTMRQALLRLGRPSAQEAQRSLAAFRQGQLPEQLESQAQDIAMSLLGFFEDAYGRGALAAILRDQVSHPTATLAKSTTKVLGHPWAYLWQQWFHYYYRDLWRDIARGKAPLRLIPAPKAPAATR